MGNTGIYVIVFLAFCARAEVTEMGGLSSNGPTSYWPTSGMTTEMPFYHRGYVAPDFATYYEDFEWYAEYHEYYTWAVAIYAEYYTEYPSWKSEFKCGGVLLTKTTVLTSAECIYKQRVRDANLVVRTFDWAYAVTFSIVHPNYRESTQENNIGILHIESLYLRGIPPLLSNQLTEDSNGNTIYQPDFAELSDSTFDKDVEKKRVNCSIFANNETAASMEHDYGPLVVMQSSPTKYHGSKSCKKHFKKKTGGLKNMGNKMKQSMMICTKDNGPKGDRRKLCDSADGWVLGCNDGGMFRLVGILFHNQTSCNKGPNVYTKVSKYRDWIDRMIKTDVTIFHGSGSGGP